MPSRRGVLLWAVVAAVDVGLVWVSSQCESRDWTPCWPGRRAGPAYDVTGIGSGSRGRLEDLGEGTTQRIQTALQIVNTHAIFPHRPGPSVAPPDNPSMLRAGSALGNRFVRHATCSR